MPRMSALIAVLIAADLDLERTISLVENKMERRSMAVITGM